MPMLDSMAKNSGIKPEGVCSSTRIPSLGEWQRLLSTSSMFMYYGATSMLNLISPHQLMELIDCYKGKACVVLDRINP